LLIGHFVKIVFYVVDGDHLGFVVFTHFDFLSRLMLITQQGFLLGLGY